MGYNIEDADDYGWDDKTLRDEFAMAALSGVIRVWESHDNDFTAKKVYEIADAMLEARKER